MEKKENTGTKLNVLLCNLVDYVRGDDRPLVFAVMQEITEYFEQELDRAREEGVIPDVKRFNKLVDRKVAERLQKIAENIPCNYIGANEMAINILNKEARSILREELSKLTTK